MTDVSTHLIQKYNCSPTPLGGWLNEYYRSNSFPCKLGHASAAAVLLILEKGQFNQRHRVEVDEIWLYHHGAPLSIQLSTENGDPSSHILAAPGVPKCQPCIFIPANTWMTARCIESSNADYSCASCITVPAFMEECLTVANTDANTDNLLPPVPNIPLKEAKSLSSQEIIEMYNLSPLPEEGGMFTEIYRSAFHMEDSDAKECATLIYYMLAGNQQSAWHSLTCDELWFYLGGAPLIQTIIAPDKTLSKRIIGPNTTDDEHVFSYIPAHYYQTAKKATENKDDWSLVACLTVPAFDFEMFTPHTDEEIKNLLSH